jgi:hypothetical protein
MLGNVFGIAKRLFTKPYNASWYGMLPYPRSLDPCLTNIFMSKDIKRT